VLFSLLALGFVLGIRHALEADHVAAVATLATRASSPRVTARLAAMWGAGHAATLFVVAGSVVLLGAAIPDGLARVLEGAAGALLIVLGMDVLRRLRRQHVHFHVHQHGGGVRHLHAHAHAVQAGDAHHAAPHEHEHAPLVFWRALLVGGVHGMAGSAALVVLSLQSVSSPLGALGYVAVFGLGSVLGMVLFSMAIALPFRLRARRLEGAWRSLQAALGAASIALGAWVVLRAGLGH
jgi:ABC-type nickel/cobalt efflux system permease component RcnA